MNIGYRIGQVLAALLILAMIVAVGWFAIYGIPWLIKELYTLYNRAETEFKLGLLTAVVSTAGVVWSVLYQRRRELESLNFEKKREAYTGFFDLLFEFMDASDTDVDIVNDPQTKVKLRAITRKLMVWGSADTINAFNKFQVDSLQVSDDVKVIFKNMENLLLQFRKDLGHNDKKLSDFALAKLIVRADDHHSFD